MACIASALTTASVNELFGPVVRALDYCPGGPGQRWGQLLLKIIITITITLQFLHYHYHYHYTLFGNVIITITITLAM